MDIITCDSEVILYGDRSFWGKRFVHCPEYGGCPLVGGSKCTIYMVRSIGGTGFVRCLEVVCFSEGLLLEVLLYIYNHVSVIPYHALLAVA